MGFEDALAVPAATRFSIAGGVATTVALVSLVHAPDVIARTGPLGLVGVDKWIHAGSYALVAFLVGYAVRAPDKWTMLAVATGAVILGAGVESIQGTIPWRTQETADVFANAAGAVLGGLVWNATWRRLPVSTGEASRRNQRGGRGSDPG